MIDKELLDKMAVRDQTHPRNVYREYCQHLFLSFLYKQKQTNFIQFKGGTAFRIYFKSPRYSEDLDFSAFELSVKEIEDMVLEVVDELEKANLNPQIQESNGTTGGYLAELLVYIYKQPITIAIQASGRDKKYKSPNVAAIDSEYIPSYVANLLNEEEMIKEKLTATLTRAKPRDFFDVYFLLRKGVVKAEDKKDLQKMVDSIQEKKINFKTELGEFLPKNLHPIIATFKEAFIREAGRNF